MLTSRLSVYLIGFASSRHDGLKYVLLGGSLAFSRPRCHPLGIQAVAGFLLTSALGCSGRRSRAIGHIGHWRKGGPHAKHWRGAPLILVTLRWLLDRATGHATPSYLGSTRS